MHAFHQTSCMQLALTNTEMDEKDRCDAECLFPALYDRVHGASRAPGLGVRGVKGAAAAPTPGKRVRSAVEKTAPAAKRQMTAEKAPTAVEDRKMAKEAPSDKRNHGGSDGAAPAAANGGQWPPSEPHDNGPLLQDLAWPPPYIVGPVTPPGLGCLWAGFVPVSALGGGSGASKVSGPQLAPGGTALLPPGGSPKGSGVSLGELLGEEEEGPVGITLATIAADYRQLHKGSELMWEKNWDEDGPVVWEEGDPAGGGIDPWDYGVSACA